MYLLIAGFVRFIPKGFLAYAFHNIYNSLDDYSHFSQVSFNYFWPSVSKSFSTMYMLPWITVCLFVMPKMPIHMTMQKQRSKRATGT